MEYDFPLFRPPSEAKSLIFQVTLGCSWNRCRFCTSYRTKEFRVRPFEEVERDVVEMSRRAPDARKIFLADGDPMAAPTDHLMKVLDLMNRRFPSLERISTYAGPTNLMAKTPEELRMLKGRKLDLLYLGIETGNDELLKRVTKGATAEQIVEGSRKALQAGLRMSAFIILGLGGVDGSHEHAKDSARVVNDIGPQFLATLTLMVGPDARAYEEKVMGGGFTLDRQDAVPAGAPVVRRRPGAHRLQVRHGARVQLPPHHGDDAARRQGRDPAAHRQGPDGRLPRACSGRSG